MIGMFAELAAGLVLLHSPNGHGILINPAAVTSMQAAVPGKANANISEAVRCLINTSDGKFVAVIETCDQVREALRKNE
jgi:hypothetical protein